MEEIWIDVKGYEDSYQVSNFGNVKSKDKVQEISNYTRFKKGKKLSPAKDSHGYYTVKLYKDGASKTHGLHVVVAISFLNHVPSGVSRVVDHIDNDKSNNNLSNIQVISQRENLSKDKKDKTSKYTGVYLNKQGNRNRWKSVIQNNNKKIFLGYYDCETSAHIAYTRKLKEINRRLISG